MYIMYNLPFSMKTPGCVVVETKDQRLLLFDNQENCKEDSFNAKM
jgi:hypothetical protein